MLNNDGDLDHVFWSGNGRKQPLKGERSQPALSLVAPVCCKYAQVLPPLVTLLQLWWNKDCGEEVHFTYFPSSPFLSSLFANKCSLKKKSSQPTLRFLFLKCHWTPGGAYMLMSLDLFWLSDCVLIQIQEFQRQDGKCCYVLCSAPCRCWSSLIDLMALLPLKLWTCAIKWSNK